MQHGLAASGAAIVRNCDASAPQLSNVSPEFVFEFYMRGKLHLEDWISARLKLSEINEGFAAMKAGKTVRSVVVFDG